MCYAIYIPIICAAETLTRLSITVLYAAEDVIRLIIQAVISYVTTIVHLFALIPMCIAKCCSKKICTSFNHAGWSPRTTPSSCGCTFIIVMVLGVFFIVNYTDWIEHVLELIGIQLPWTVIRKNKEVDYSDYLVKNKMIEHREYTININEDYTTFITNEAEKKDLNLQVIAHGNENYIVFDMAQFIQDAENSTYNKSDVTFIDLNETISTVKLIEDATVLSYDYTIIEYKETRNNNPTKHYVVEATTDDVNLNTTLPISFIDT
ncbi:hypothetical protein O3G_MSEX014054 [Manduca sexta]|uniref:Uncharacterized protein n=1 Tax=Manduca sexta TaxID=7130 RepID=A0A921ZV30_MANSE|nr:hypothetical protein O3G_MSEX014054 [Manduca sexta]